MSMKIYDFSLIDGLLLLLLIGGSCNAKLDPANAVELAQHRSAVFPVDSFSTPFLLLHAFTPRAERALKKLCTTSSALLQRH